MADEERRRKLQAGREKVFQHMDKFHYRSMYSFQVMIKLMVFCRTVGRSLFRLLYLLHVVTPTGVLSAVGSFIVVVDKNNFYSGHGILEQ